ncbi:MAG: hypothetical protein KatS3mg054_0616 [Chloroflexus sp.]|nr:MAG: hypothetical protein KatS3mg054_0616 [Chloroflexus sp.]
MSITEQILNEIKEYYKQSELQDGDVTTEMVARELGVSEETARVFMNRLISEGKFERVKVRVDGHKRTAYRPVK